MTDRPYIDGRWTSSVKGGTFRDACERSGIGRGLGRRGLDNDLETTQITRLVGDGPWGWYIK